MSEPYVREYDERCEYIADTIDQHQVFSLPLSGYGELSGEKVMGYEIEVEFTEDCIMGKGVTKKVGNRIRQVANCLRRDNGTIEMILANAASVSVPNGELSSNRHIFKLDNANLSAGIDDVTTSLSVQNLFPYPLWFYYGADTFANHDTRIYSMKLYGADGQLLYNYIPVRTGHSGNFYDTINKQMLWSLDGNS